ncbi:hypothetical protein [Pseudoalteromonas piscicida]|uniref:hypothetical protein n=1 Tax=Pseudoalteromonas piscicida TaxID=43662 RepID=UPI000E3585AA|nr:hypothetical protein [Pseudoalteromonas piscicida]AXQ98299.1 hypothetical protein D0N37_11525 [Pseudoalteromonas piscicida]
MKNILKIAAFSTLLLGTAQAASTQEQIKVVDYNTFYDTQVNNVDCGGYWDERRVWVCDYRTELVDVSYKTCHYKFDNPSYPYAEPWATKTVRADQSCPNNWIVPDPHGYHPRGQYIHQHNTYSTQQEERRVAYNCRWETRSVWIPRGGSYCPIPNAK